LRFGKQCFAISQGESERRGGVILDLQFLYSSAQREQVSRYQMGHGQYISLADGVQIVLDGI